MADAGDGAARWPPGAPAAPLGWRYVIDAPARPAKPHAGRPVALAALCLFAGAVIVGGMSHEPWFDEAQAWLIARDASPAAIVGHWTHYEGSPGLWHLLLWTFQRLGGSYGALWTVSATLGVAGAALVLLRAPWPLWMRIGVVFSYFPLYQFSVVARSYALDLLLIPLAAILFEGRLRRPLAYGCLLGVLANTNAHSFAIAAALAGEFCLTLLAAGRWRTARRLGGVALYGVLALAAVVQAWPTYDPLFRSGGGIGLRPLRPLWLLPDAFIDGVGDADPGERMSRVAAELIAVVLVLTPLAALWRAAGQGRLALAVFGALSIMTASVTSRYWHSGLFFLAATFCLWTSWGAAPKLDRPTRVWLLTSLVAMLGLQDVLALMALGRDVTAPYSSGRAAAEALEQLHVTDQGQTLGVEGFKAFSVVPYFKDRIFANVHPSAPGAAYEWRADFTETLFATAKSWRDLTSGRRYDWLLLSTDTGGEPAPPFTAMAAQSGYRLVRRFPGNLIWKNRTLEQDELLLFHRAASSATARAVVAPTNRASGA